MSRNAIIRLLSVVVLAALVPATHGQLIEIGLTAEVYGVEDFNNLLDGLIQAGDTITGSYTYDSEAVDTMPNDPSTGNYEFVGLEFGISLAINGLEFRTTPYGYYGVGIGNDLPRNNPDVTRDIYTVGSYDNKLLSNGTPVDQIYWQLTTYSGLAIADISLPTQAPNLSDWTNGLIISGSIPDTKQRYSIGAEVTSAWLIPEPATLILLGLGSLLIRKRISQ